MNPSSERIEGMVLSFGRFDHRIHPQTNITGETPYMKIVTIASPRPTHSSGQVA